MMTRRRRGDADGMARDLAEARRLFAEMGVTGWDDYARAIETCAAYAPKSRRSVSMGMNNVRGPVGVGSKPKRAWNAAVFASTNSPMPPAASATEATV